MNRAERIKGYEFGVFHLDTGNRLLLRDGVPVSLTLKSYDLLAVLVENRGNVLEKEKLMELVWPAHFVEEANLSHHVYLLRKALGDDKNGNTYIETIPRRGYRFVMEVRELVLSPLRTEGQLTDAQDASEASPRATKNAAWVMPQRIAPSDLHSATLDERATETHPASPSTSSRSELRARNWLWLIVASLTVMTAVGVYALWSRVVGGPRALQASILPFTTLPGQENQPALSPDSSRVAFCWNGEKEDNFDIYVKVVGTPSQLRLTSDPTQDTSPAWSPDGRLIAFHRNTGPGSGFYVVSALGGIERLVAKAFPARANFRGHTVDWFPDGKSLAIIERDSEAEPFHISIVSLETGEKRRLISPVPPSTGVMGLAVSPDGNTLAFTAFMDGKPDLPRKHMDLYVVSSEGGTPRRLTFAEGGVVGITWTPDSRHIVFLPFSYKSGRAGPDLPVSLSRISPLDGKRELVPVPPYWGYMPANPHLSRFGNRLLVLEQRWIGNTVDIWRAPGPTAAGGNTLPAKLIASSAPEQDPHFSPDGKRIAFTSFASGPLALWVSDREGLNAVELTSMESKGISHPRWSPDGSQIAFHCAGDIWVIRSDGGPVRRLTSDLAAESFPSWSMDGRWIYFASDRSGAWQVWKTPSDGGSATQVTRNGGAEAFESLDGNYLFFTKYNGLPWTFALSSVWRMPVGGGQETRVIEKTSVGYWGLTTEGISFLNAEGDLPFAFEFLNFKSRTKRVFALLDREPLWNSPSFAVSPDGKAILYARRPSEERDVMLLENFN